MENVKIYSGKDGGFYSDHTFAADMLKAVLKVADTHKRSVHDTKQVLKTIRRNIDEFGFIKVTNISYLDKGDVKVLPLDDSVNDSAK